MENILIFDVDGTLTGQRRLIQEDFARFFKWVVQTETVYLVTGSNMSKLEKQIPDWLMKSVAGAFTCSGNAYHEKGETIFRMSHTFPQELEDFAQELVDNSPYEERAGVHLEQRTGSLNVSVIGRNATPMQRSQYELYDEEAGERKAMIDAIGNAFPDYEVNRGGQISVDVSPKGWNKSRVYTELLNKHPDHVFSFFGDNIRDGGNDLPLARAVQNGKPDNKVYAVKDHFETWKILQELYSVEMRATGT